MKRFLLFSGADYYPQGGFSDFKGSFESIDACLEKYVALSNTGSPWSRDEWGQVVDTQECLEFTIMKNHAGLHYVGDGEPFKWDLR